MDLFPLEVMLVLYFILISKVMYNVFLELEGFLVNLFFFYSFFNVELGSLRDLEILDLRHNVLEGFQSSTQGIPLNSIISYTCMQISESNPSTRCVLNLQVFLSIIRGDVREGYKPWSNPRT